MPVDLYCVCVQSLLGQVDLAFLGTYAVGMFYAGHLGDRLDLRWFLTIGKAVHCFVGWTLTQSFVQQSLYLQGVTHPVFMPDVRACCLQA